MRSVRKASDWANAACACAAASRVVAGAWASSVLANKAQTTNARSFRAGRVIWKKYCGPSRGARDSVTACRQAAALQAQSPDPLRLSLSLCNQGEPQRGAKMTAQGNALGIDI